MNLPFVSKLKPKYLIEIGGFILSFYFKENDIKNTFLQIDTVSGIWSMRIDGRTHPFGYLYAAASQGNETQLHGYAALMYRTAMALTQSQEFVNGLTKEINKLDRYIMKEAEKAAKSVSKHQELADAELMREAIERGKPMSRQQRRKMERESRKEMKQILDEDKE